MSSVRHSRQWVLMSKAANVFFATQQTISAVCQSKNVHCVTQLTNACCATQETMSAAWHIRQFLGGHIRNDTADSVSCVAQQTSSILTQVRRQKPLIVDIEISRRDLTLEMGCRTSLRYVVSEYPTTEEFARINKQTFTGL